MIAARRAKLRTMRIRLKRQRLIQEMAQSRATQSTWARQLGVSESYLSRLLNGNRNFPGPAMRRQMLKRLGLSFEDLFEVVDERMEPFMTGRPADSEAPGGYQTREAEPVMSHLRHDFLHGLRILIRKPRGSLATILTLALGIGAATSMFSLVFGILLRPLPIADPGRVVRVIETRQVQPFAVSVPNFRDWREMGQAFQAMAAHSGGTANLIIDGVPSRVPIRQVTSDYFRALGIEPLLGRSFRAEEESTGSDPVVLLAEAEWETRFARDSEVLGKHLRINKQEYEIIGVLPDYRIPHFVFPLALDIPSLDRRGRRTVQVVGRLRPEINLERAQQSMELLAAQLAEEYPANNAAWRVRVDPLTEVLLGEAKAPLYLLMGAVAILLLIGCANVAGLNLLRSVQRSRELAIRSALGASRRRLLQQLVAEHLVQGLVGGTVGLIGARLTVSMVGSFFAGFLPRTSEVRLSFEVVFFAIGVSILAGLLSGLLPALTSSHIPAGEMLANSGRSISAGVPRRRLQSAFVVTEMALAIILLVGAGLFLRSLASLLDVDLGLEPNNVTTFRLTFPGDRYREAFQIQTALQVLEKQLESVPGVLEAELVTHLPFSGQNMSSSFQIRGREQQEGANQPNAGFRIVSPGYFSLLGIPVLEGRAFASTDQVNSIRVALINQRAAATYFPDVDPIGQSISFENDQNDQPIWSEVVGVVGDVRHFGPAADAILEIYQSSLQADDGWAWIGRTVGIVVKRRASISERQIRDAVAVADPLLPLFALREMESRLDDTTYEPRLRAILLGSFGGLALFLAAVGVYSLMSFRVQSQQREFRIRIAIGARSIDVVRMILGKALWLICIGVTLGLLGAFLLSSLISTFLFQVDPVDGFSFLISVALISAVALLAALIPASRAARFEHLAFWSE